MIRGIIGLQGTVKEVNYFLDTAILAVANEQGGYGVKRFNNFVVFDDPHLRSLESGGYDGQLATVILNVGCYTAPNVENVAQLSKRYNLKAHLQLSSAEQMVNYDIMTDSVGRTVKNEVMRF